MTADKTTYKAESSYGKLRRMFVWLRRIGHSRGFGVQSPWAYRMVRYVINEHYPYYAYESLALDYPQLDTVERKICELCLRLANSVQPSLIVSFGGSDSAYGAYFSAGCRNARIESAAYDCGSAALASLLDGLAGCFIVRMVPCTDLCNLFATVCKAATTGSVVMLQGIYSDPSTRREWRRIVSCEPGVVTFDLYYCGLVFFDEKRYKQNYIINF